MPLSAPSRCRAARSSCPLSFLPRASLGFVLLALLLPAVLAACSDSGPLPIGRPAKGDSLIVAIQQVERVQELRFRGTDQVHYLVKPAMDGNELVVAWVQVHNDEATRVVLTVDEEAAELRGFDRSERYPPLDMYDLESLMGTHVQVVDGTHPSEDRFVPFLAGPIQVGGIDGLPEGHQVEGWMVFEVPEGVKLKEMRWGAGDVVYVTSS